MREIKFRAWHKIFKVMFRVRVMEMTDGFVDYISGNDYVTQYQSDMKTIKDIILMQFTGLLDKNGKEIYEGDIIKYKYNSLLRFVKWHDKYAGYVFTYRPDLGDSDKLSEGLIRAFKPEIIGNIYENPELLKTPMTKPN